MLTSQPAERIPLEAAAGICTSLSKQFMSCLSGILAFIYNIFHFSQSRCSWELISSCFVSHDSRMEYFQIQLSPKYLVKFGNKINSKVKHIFRKGCMAWPQTCKIISKAKCLAWAESEMKTNLFETMKPQPFVTAWSKHWNYMVLGCKNKNKNKTKTRNLCDLENPRHL